MLTSFKYAPGPAQRRRRRHRVPDPEGVSEAPSSTATIDASPPGSVADEVGLDRSFFQDRAGQVSTVLDRSFRTRSFQDPLVEDPSSMPEGSPLQSVSSGIEPQVIQSSRDPEPRSPRGSSPRSDPTPSSAGSLPCSVPALLFNLQTSSSSPASGWGDLVQQEMICTPAGNEILGYLGRRRRHGGGEGRRRRRQGLSSGIWLRGADGLLGDPAPGHSIFKRS